MKRKQFIKGMEQIAQEGAIQIFQSRTPVWKKSLSALSASCSWKSWSIVSRTNTVDIIMENLPYQYLRWIENEDFQPDELKITSDSKVVQDYGRYLLLFTAWEPELGAGWKNEGLQLAEFEVAED